MVEFLLFCLASVGLCHIVVDGSIFEPVRQYFRYKNWSWLVKLTSCYQCAGFWSGLAVALCFYIPYSLPLLYALAGSFLSTICAVLIIHFSNQQNEND